MPELLSEAARTLRGKVCAMLVAVPLLAGTVGAGTAAARTSSPTCRGANLAPNTFNRGSVDAATLCLIDEVRTAYHLRPLQFNGELWALATSQVNDMVSWNYFADDRPPGLTPLSLLATTRYPAHTRSVTVGQNIGWGTGCYATPTAMVAAWMASPEHRRIMLTRKYRDAGVGVTAAVPPLFGDGLVGATYAIEFASRRF
jgi:uncharacterized protein YkwD